MTRPVTRVVLVPGVLALLPEYAGSIDPVPELRAACVDAVAGLGESVEVIASPQGQRVAEALLEVAGSRRRSLALAARPPESAAARPPESLGVAARPPESAAARPPEAYLVVGNGSACRTEKAPGHLDPRAADFDAELGRALISGDLAALAGTDPELSRELWAETDALRKLAALLTPGAVPEVFYDDAPFGVQYWVLTWG